MKSMQQPMRERAKNLVAGELVGARFENDNRLDQKSGAGVSLRRAGV